MGCKYCQSGLGSNCDGPLGLDDLSVSCDCSCHKCDFCMSAYCETVGGPDPREREEHPDEFIEEDYMRLKNE